MTKIRHGRTVAILLAALLAAMVLAPLARADTVVTNSFPVTPGATAFVSERDGADNFDFYRMNADGFGQVNLTRNPALDWQPAWQPIP